MSLRHRYNIESITTELKASERHYLKISTAGRLSIALVFPNLYSLGMSNLGFLTVHKLLGSIPEVGVERFFPALVPDLPLTPPYYSFESGRPLGDFDIIMFSISFEGDFDKIPGIFSALGFPVLASERNKKLPLLIAGGAAVCANAAAMSRIFDILIPGEAETTVVPVIETLLSKGFDKEKLSEIPGVWVPSLNTPQPAPGGAYDVSRDPAYAHIVSSQNAFGGAHIIEVMRGCPRCCSFCLARAIYSPPRPVLLNTIENWLSEHSDCRDIGLVAPSLFDHPQVIDLFEMLTDRGIHIRNSSVKWEKLTPELMKLLQKSGVNSITVAPETGSAKLRAAIHKPMDENRFMAKLEEIFANGFEHVKMYFVTCMPGEDDSDIEATAAFIEKALAHVPSYSSISATFSVFIPKHYTPWANEPAPKQYTIKKHIKYLKSLLGKLPAQFKANYESPQESVRQAYLTQVGPELADIYSQEAKECRENRLFSKNQFSALDF